MSTSFVVKNGGVIVGLSFDEDPSFDLKIKAKKDIVYGLSFYNGAYHEIFGVNKDGAVSNLLRVPTPNKPSSINSASPILIDELCEAYLNGKYSLDQVQEIASSRSLANPKGFSLHSQLSDSFGRVLLLEPGRGIKLREEDFSVLTNLSFFEPILSEPDSPLDYEHHSKVRKALEGSLDSFNVQKGLELLDSISVKEGSQVTLASFLYSSLERKAYWKLRGDPELHSWQF